MRRRRRRHGYSLLDGLVLQTKIKMDETSDGQVPINVSVADGDDV